MSPQRAPDLVDPDRRSRRRTGGRWASSHSGGVTFPSTGAQDEYVSRRELVKFMVLTERRLRRRTVWLVLKSVFTPAAPALAPRAHRARRTSCRSAARKTFNYPAGSSPRLLVRTGAAPFVAYDQQCTHSLCPVVPVVDEGRLHCPCHNGWFDLRPGARWRVRLSGRCRGSSWTCAMGHLRDGCGGDRRHEPDASRFVRVAADDDRQRHAGIRRDARRPAAVAADGDDVNAYLGGDHAIVVPALGASLVCFGLNAGLLRYLYRLE